MPRLSRLENAVRLAKQIRHDLLQERRINWGHSSTRNRTLAGKCGVASSQLCIAMNDPEIMRVGYFKRKRTSQVPPPAAINCGSGSTWDPHAWVEIGSVIIDITATQFGRHPAIAVFPRSHPTQALYSSVEYGAEAMLHATEWIYDTHANAAVHAFLNSQSSTRGTTVS